MRRAGRRRPPPRSTRVGCSWRCSVRPRPSDLPLRRPVAPAGCGRGPRDERPHLDPLPNEPLDAQSLLQIALLLRVGTGRAAGGRGTGLGQVLDVGDVVPFVASRQDGNDERPGGAVQQGHERAGPSRDRHAGDSPVFERDGRATGGAARSDRPRPPRTRGHRPHRPARRRAAGSSSRTVPAAHSRSVGPVSGPSRSARIAAGISSRSPPHGPPPAPREEHWFDAGTEGAGNDVFALRRAPPQRDLSHP